GKLELPGTVHRELTFEGSEIRIRAEDLPDQVKCAEAVVPGDEKDFVLRCEGGSGAKLGAFPIRIASRAPNTGRKTKEEYKIADPSAKLVIGEGNRKEK